MKKYFAAQLLCSATCLLGAQHALAAAPAAPPAQEGAADTDANGGLAEIIVTAQKRSENVQRTPLSITAVQGAALAAKGITTVQELNRVDPTLQIGQATGIVTTFIRGIGNPITTSGNEASVPVYIDDVYFVRAGFPFFDLASIERVEVLKGPQGTLFGRNASGGVISIYTKDPSQTPEFMGDVGYGNFNTFDVKAYGNVPITDNLAANLSVSYHDQKDGWGLNKTLVDRSNPSLGYNPGGTPYWYGHHLSMRGKILWEPTEHTKVKLIGYYENSWSNIGEYARPFPGTVGGSPDPAHNGVGGNAADAPVPAQVLPPLGFYDVSVYAEQFDRSKGYGGSVRIDQDLGFADLVSITAARENKELYRSAGNYSDYDWLKYDLHVLDDQFSQEVQLKSKPSSKVSWIVGAYFLSAHGGFDPTYIYGPGEIAAPGVPLTIALYGREHTKSLAGFTQVTYPIDDNTHITGGLRYTHDTLKGYGTTLLSVAGGPYFNPGGDFNPSTTPDASPTFNKLTWKANLDHSFAPDVMAYANYSRGFKAGLFNTLPLNAPALKPEIVDAYEIGLKTEMFDRHLRLNVAAFWNDITNPQVSTQINGLVALTNAGKARTKGIEFDATLAAARGLTLRLAGSYLDAKYLSFPDAPSYILNTVAAPGHPAGTAGGNWDQIFIDASGHSMPYASKVKLTGGLDYVTDLKQGKVALNVNVNYSSKFNWDADNLVKEPEHVLVDWSVSFTPAADDHLTFKFWMKNATGEKWNLNYYAQASGSGLSSAPGAPRTFGGNVIVKF